MKRLLIALLLLVPSLASAKAVVVRVDNSQSLVGTGGAIQRADYTTAVNLLMQYVTTFLDAHSTVGYDVVPASIVQTSLIKDGIVTGKNSGAAYDAVIWVGLGSTNANNLHAGCYPCSLTTVTMMPTKPQLFLGTQLGEVCWPSATQACSTGAGGECYDPGGQGPSYGEQRIGRPGSMYTFPTIPGAQGGRTFNQIDSAATYPGMRTVVGMSLANIAGFNDPGVDYRPANKRPAWRDSLFGYTETVAMYANTMASTGDYSNGMYGSYVLDKQNTHKGTAGQYAPITVVRWLATSIATTGGTSITNDLRPNGNPLLVWAGIAHVDSLSGFRVLGTSPNVKKIAVQVQGGLSRGAWNGDGGLRPSDPNFAYACDSLKSLGVPVTVGVRPLADTVSTYASDVATWRRIGSVRFAVEASFRDTSTLAGLGNSSPVKPLDMCGRYRSRVFWADTSGRNYPAVALASSWQANDTTVANLLRASKARLDSLVGESAVDRVLIADDWSPKNWPFPSAPRDSFALAASRAGFVGVAEDAEGDSLDAVTPSNPQGFRSVVQQRASIGGGSGFNFYAYPGMNRNGGAFGQADGDSSWCAIYSNRAIRALYLPYWRLPEKNEWVVNSSRAGMATTWYAEPGTSYTSALSTQTRCNILRISASSLGYGGNGPSADMPGFYTVKYTVNMAKLLNDLAGRALVQFVFPDQLDNP